MVQYFLACDVCKELLMTGGEEVHLKFVHKIEVETTPKSALEEVISQTFRLIQIPSDSVSDGAH